MGIPCACIKNIKTTYIHIKLVLSEPPVLYGAQIYIKLTWFKDNDDRKFLLKYYWLRCCSFLEVSKTISFDLMSRKLDD